jgi:monofunctional biosynthetic peptidoglycan transglycosylase
VKKWIALAVIFFFGLPVLVVAALGSMPPPITSFMLQSEVKPVHYQWVPASLIAEVARKAVIASEDQKFREHHGFDIEAMQKAYKENRRRRHQRGASTISQQTAKNLFLWQGGGYFRKGIEAGFTVLIEAMWSKDRILEMYLNIAEFGPGIYGVEAASRSFFNKPASALTPEEAARLAAVLPNPRHWNAGSPSSYVLSRADWVLGQMGYAAKGRKLPSEEPIAPPAEAAPEEGMDQSPEDNQTPDTQGPDLQENKSPENTEPAPDVQKPQEQEDDQVPPLPRDHVPDDESPAPGGSEDSQQNSTPDQAEPGNPPAEPKDAPSDPQQDNRPPPDAPSEKLTL